MPRVRQVLSVTLLTSMLFTVASCNKKGESPTGPSDTQSVWTGTLTRPSGLGTMTVSWPATTDANGNFSGPMTLTLNGVSLTIPTFKGGVAGNSSAYKIHIEFTANTGEIAALPSCKMNGASTTPDAGDPFTSPYDTINVAVQMFYTGCSAFIGSLNVQETAQLNVTK